MTFSNFGIVEWLALITMVIGGVKIIGLLINPRSMLDMGKSFSRNAKALQWVFFVLAAGVLYALTLGGVSIVTILAVALFMSFLIGAYMVPYADKVFKAIKPKEFLAQAWLAMIVWIVLIVWGFIALF